MPARVLIGGRDVARTPSAARDVAFVFQQFSLYPHMSVFENLAFPLRAPIRGRAGGRDRARVREVARAAADRGQAVSPASPPFPAAQMQRVAIGRALVRSPTIYLMDEPLSSLDAKLRADLRVEIKRIQQDLGATILFVTHDQTEAMTMADRVGVMEHGRLVQIGSPREIYRRPNEHLCRHAPRQSRDQPPAAPAGPRTAGRRRRSKQSARAPSMYGSARPMVRAGWVRSPGSSISATRTTCTSVSADHDFVTLSDPDSGLAPGDQVDINFVSPLFFDHAGTRVRRMNETIDAATLRRLIETVADRGD